MDSQHLLCICNNEDIIILPDEFVNYHGKKYIKIVGLSLNKQNVNNIDFPYVIISEKLARLNYQNRISLHLQNTTNEELNYITNTFTLKNGYFPLIPWDYEKTFDIKIKSCLNGVVFNQDYIIEFELIRN